jgi:hypothetical protein
MEKIYLDNGDAVYINMKKINFLIIHKTFVEFNFSNGQTYIINRQNCSEIIAEIEKKIMTVIKWY